MRFLSVCSGIEAASVAWRPFGWEAVAFSEIEPFPCAVLAHHYPNVPNWGDMTKFQEWPDVAVDLLCGGTPCQSFSVAGLRKGLADPRGNLMLTFGAIAAKYWPRWLVWENVPGVLSSNEGRDFGSFLGMLGQLGYGFAYRVLDAQYVRVESHPRAVPQRRRRVFVVGHLGDWRRAAAVLFERESLSGHPAPRREAGERTPAGAPCSTAISSGHGWWDESEVGATVRAQDSVTKAGTLVANTLSAARGAACANAADLETYVPVSMCLNAKGGGGRLDAESETLIPTTGGGFDVAPVGVDSYNAAITGNVAATAGTPGSDTTGSGPQVMVPTYTLAIRGRGDSHELEYRTDGSANAVLTPNGGRGGIGVGAIAFGWQNSASQGASASASHSPTLDKSKVPGVTHGMRVRRLTPLETERLQGFPDGYTAIPYRGKPAADGPRYKSHGNSWAINVVSWIGQRIEAVEAICAEQEREAA